jgi:hypothetical protein
MAKSKRSTSATSRSSSAKIDRPFDSNVLARARQIAEQYMAMPVLKGEKTEGERFPGAVTDFLWYRQVTYSLAEVYSVHAINMRRHRSYVALLQVVRSSRKRFHLVEFRFIGSHDRKRSAGYAGPHPFGFEHHLFANARFAFPQAAFPSINEAIFGMAQTLSSVDEQITHNGWSIWIQADTIA